MQLIKPDESQVNNLGYYMLNQKQFNKAEALFKLNIANYPETANCYDGREICTWQKVIN